MKIDRCNITRPTQDFSETQHTLGTWHMYECTCTRVMCWAHIHLCEGTWTCTYAQPQTHTHTHNYLSNARCDFLGVNELIHIHEEGEGGKVFGWLEVKIFNIAIASFIITPEWQDGKLQTGRCKTPGREKDRWLALDPFLCPLQYYLMWFLFQLMLLLC